MDERRDKGWKRLQRPRFDSKHIARRMHRAETMSTRHARKFIFRRLDSIRESKTEIISWLIVVGVITAGVLFQIFWFGRAYMTTAPADGGTYVEASLGPVDTLDPLYAHSDAENAASRLMFSSLYDYDSTGHLSGDLATYMTSDSSQKVYTVNIRHDAKWSDGASLTADDVVFTINLIKNRATRSPLALSWQDIDVKALNTTTVQFTLPAVLASFPQALTFPVLPQHILSSVQPGQLRENTFSRAPVGSGPFTFRLLQQVSVGNQSTVVRMRANPNYYKGAPKLASFEIHAFKNTGQILTALQTGEVNAAASLTPNLLKRVDANRYRTMTTPVDNGVYALFNTNDNALQSSSVRQALQAATNTSVLRSQIAGDPPSLDLPFINGQLAGNDVPKPQAPSIMRADAILDHAGWKMKNGIRTKGIQQLTIPITTVKNPLYVAAAKNLAQQWAKIGVKSSVEVIDTDNPSVNFFRDTLQPRSYSVLVYQVAIGADPDVLAYWDSSQIGMNGYNYSNYSNPIADATLSSARGRVEPSIRQAKYKVFARQWLKDAPAIGLYQAQSTYVYGAGVHTMEPGMNLVTDDDRFAGVLDWAVGEKPVYKTP